MSFSLDGPGIWDVVELEAECLNNLIETEHLYYSCSTSLCERKGKQVREGEERGQREEEGKGRRETGRVFKWMSRGVGASHLNNTSE